MSLWGASGVAMGCPAAIKTNRYQPLRLPRLILEIDIGERLPAVVADAKASGLVPRQTTAGGSGELATHIACLATSNPLFKSSAFIAGSN